MRPAAGNLMRQHAGTVIVVTDYGCAMLSGKIHVYMFQMSLFAEFGDTVRIGCARDQQGVDIVGNQCFHGAAFLLRVA